MIEEVECTHTRLTPRCYICHPWQSQADGEYAPINQNTNNKGETKE